MTDRVASCPGCGGTLTFASAATVCVVCPFCGGASYRSDVDLEFLGKVAEVADIASPVELGGSGKLDGVGWTAIGRIQLDHGAGPWNEWCLLFDDGTWRWYAEAQGEALLTTAQPLADLPAPPAWDVLVPDVDVDLGPSGRFVVAEIGTGRVTAVQGELPTRVLPGAVVRYADLRGPGGTFATLDYGAGGPAVEAVYVGRTVLPEQLGLDAEKAAPVEKKVAARRLSCPKCAGIIELRDPESVRVTCQSCGALIEPTERGAKALGVGAALKLEPALPLGAQGTLRGGKVEVLAFLVRSVKVEGVRYAWREYLLRTVKGSYRWLTESHAHWTLLEPVSPGDVAKSGGKMVFQGRTFEHFQTGKATVDHVQGEVYWKVEVGETVQSKDFVAPPWCLTVEQSGNETNVTVGTYLPKEEVEAAFGVRLATPHGVAPAQPNPYRGGTGRWWGVAALLVLGMIVLMVAVSGAKGGDAVGVFFPGLFLIGGLLLPPIVVSTRASNFETRRWEDSDHPLGGSE